MATIEAVARDAESTIVGLSGRRLPLIHINVTVSSNGICSTNKPLWNAQARPRIDPNNAASRLELVSLNHRRPVNNAARTRVYSMK